MDAQVIEPKFRDRFAMSSGFKFDTSTETYLPDISTLTLFCGQDKVGSVSINLTQYIGCKAKLEKVVIASEEAVHDALDHKVLIGD